MPSGAKKRKAAKRKKGEQELGGIQHPPSPHSPSHTPQGSSGLESESSDRGEAEMDSSGSGGRGEEVAMAGERGEDAGEDYDVKEVGIEYVVSKKDINGSSTHLEEKEEPPPPPPPAAAAAAAAAAEVPISEVVVLEQLTAEEEEEEVEVSGTAASVATDIPPVSTLCEEQRVADVVERSEMAATNEVAPAPSPAPAPLLGQRATLWNCCGLLDAFKGSQR